jgi:hypothetical protein
MYVSIGLSRNTSRRNLASLDMLSFFSYTLINKNVNDISLLIYVSESLEKALVGMDYLNTKW